MHCSCHVGYHRCQSPCYRWNCNLASGHNQRTQKWINNLEYDNFASEGLASYCSLRLQLLVVYTLILLSWQSTQTTIVCLLVGCLTSQQQASVSQGRICSDNFTCCHTEIEVADQTFYLTQSQYTDTGPTSPSADPITPGAWQGSHWSANFEVTGMTRPRKNPGASGIRTRDLPLSRRTPYH